MTSGGGGSASDGDGIGSRGTPGRAPKNPKSAPPTKAELEQAVALQQATMVQSSMRGASYGVYLCSGGISIGSQSWLPKFGPCYFVALVRLIQTQSGHTFGVSEFQRIISKCINANVFNTNYSQATSDFWDISYRGHEKILRIAAGVAGYDLIGYDKEICAPGVVPKIAAVGSVRKIAYKYGPHFQECDSSGNFVSDPYWPSSPSIDKILRVDYYTFSLRRRK